MVDADRAPVLQRKLEHAVGAGPEFDAGVGHVVRECHRRVADFFAMGDDVFERGSRLNELGRKLVHLHVAGVAEDHVPVPVEHAHAMRQVGQRRLEPALGPGIPGRTFERSEVARQAWMISWKSR